MTQARSGVAGEIEFTDASASKPKVTLIAGQWLTASDQATAKRLKAGESAFNEVKARDLSAAFEPGASKGEWTFSIGQAQARSGCRRRNRFDERVGVERERDDRRRTRADHLRTGRS